MKIQIIHSLIIQTNSDINIKSCRRALNNLTYYSHCLQLRPIDGESFYEVYMFQEEWKDVPTWQGVYQFSTFGRLKRLKGGRVKQDQIHLGKDAGNGYLRFVLTQGKRKERWDMHVLAATVWQRPLLEGEEVHHKNKFKFCNCVWNIQIRNGDEHAQEHGAEKKGKVGPNKGKKMSEQQKEKIRQSHLGKPAWNKGKKMSSQWRIKDSLTGRFVKNINNTEQQFKERTIT